MAWKRFLLWQLGRTSDWTWKVRRFELISTKHRQAMMLQERSFKLKEQAVCVLDICTCLHIRELGLFKFFRREGLWRLWANMCVYEWRADRHSSFKKQDMAKGRRMVKTCWLNGKYFDAVRMSYTKGVFGSKTKQLGCRLLMTVI